MDTPSFERSSLEADMKLLATEIKNQRERPEMKGANGKDILKEAFLVFPRFEKNSNGSGVPAAQSSSTANSSSPLPAYAQSAPPEVKLEIEYLIDLAFRKGINAAFAEAGKSSAFIQDAFHDALAGRLYPELKKEGIID
jgi:hypothetical protein